MTRKLLILYLTLTGCVVYATAAWATAPDPRKCGTGTPSYCAKNAASLAFRRHMTAIGPDHRLIWSAPMKCSAVSGVLVWRCDFGAGAGTITFKALSNGWHTMFKVSCYDPAMKPADSCRSTG